MRVRHHGSLLALLTVTLLCGAGGASAQNSVASDKAALVALYNAAGGLHWTNHGNWTSTEPLSTWFGVATDGDGRVTGLALGTNGLTGTIPGQLGNLSELRTLDLHDNSLTGPIPAELGDLSELRTLDFGENYRDGQDLPGLSGPIPAALGRLSNLLSLDLGGNSLSGVIPTELGGLSHLQGLFLASNELTGEIPDSLQNLSNLRVLSLSANRLTGSIPSWLGSLSPLESLGLSFNRQDGLGLPGLTGPIPEELGNLANLKVLALQFNGLSGTIPTELGSLSSLTRLGLGSNRLSGAIPTELRNLPNIVQLYLDRNDLIGTIPDALWDLTTLEALGVEENRLSGELPLDLPSRSSPLTGLYIASNNNLCAPADDAFQAWLKPIDFSGSTCSPTSESVIDVAVFYTEAARIAEQGSENGSDAIEALIDLMIVEANGAFTEGGANVRLSLVHREEVTYTEQGTARDDLFDLFRGRFLFPAVGFSLAERAAAPAVVRVAARFGPHGQTCARPAWRDTRSRRGADVCVHMELKTILNRVYQLPDSCTASGWCHRLEIEVRPRANGRALCSGCGQPAPDYDRLQPRRFQFRR